MKKIKSLITKTKGKITALFVTAMLAVSNYSFADVVSEVDGGGQIQSSKLGQGIMNMVKDITGTLQWVLPVVGVATILVYVFKIMTGEEQEVPRYKKAIIKVLIGIGISVMAVTIINLIAKYFGK